MPPEVMVASPKYDTSVDEFSYGIMMIHMFSGTWPEPQAGPIRAEAGGRMTPVSEAERREVFLRAIGNDHPLMGLIRKCIDNHAQSRAHASEIVERLAEMVLQFPTSFANRLEMLRQFEAVTKEKIALREEGERKDRAIQEKESQMSSLREEVRAKEEQKTAEIDRLKLAHSSEVEQLQLQVRDVNAQSQLVTAKLEAEVTELKLNTTICKSQIETNSKAMIEERERFKHMIAKEREQSEFHLAHEREVHRKLMADNQDFQSDLTKLNTMLQVTISELQADVVEKGSAVEMKSAAIKRKDDELEAKSRALEEKDAIISAMSEQVTKTREYLTKKQQLKLHDTLKKVTTSST